MLYLEVTLPGFTTARMAVLKYLKLSSSVDVLWFNIILHNNCKHDPSDGGLWQHLR